MESNPQEPTLARFKAFWLVIGLILAVAVLGLAMRWLGSPREEIDTAAETARLNVLVETREAQQKAVEGMGLTYHDPEGGHLPRVTLPDPLLDKAVATLRQKTAHKTEQIIPGSKTFLENQAKQHDPVESFLKK